jgi:hypothetical protein
LGSRRFDIARKRAFRRLNNDNFQGERAMADGSVDIRREARAQTCDTFPVVIPRRT